MTISTNVDWNKNPPNGMLQFSSFTITSTGSLVVPSGLVIRVSGNVNISGPITVASPARVIYTFPTVGSCTPIRLGFAGGKPIAGGLDAVRARALLKPTDVSYSYFGVGGHVTILAAGSIAIGASGSISAVGKDGSNTYSLFSASGGGIVILASRTSINNAGALIATGGNGADGFPGGPLTPFEASGGGGGGGIIHLLAPSIVVGATDVSGGSGGSNGSDNTPFRFPGGACGGSGGTSGATGSPGAPGYVFTTIVSEPAFLFFP